MVKLKLTKEDEPEDIVFDITKYKNTPLDFFYSYDILVKHATIKETPMSPFFIDYSYSPYKLGKGRKCKPPKSYYKPISVRNKIKICNHNITNENKMKFFNFFFKWFKKDPKWYYIEFDLTKKYIFGKPFILHMVML